MYFRSKVGSFTFAALALALVAGGCAERPPRSFVQPNVIKKSDLEGTWYYLQTVTDAPVTSSFIFIGNSSELMKVKFDIQENTLFARRAYEQIEGSEDAYKQDPSKYIGQPLAAWRISSQFDIIRDYNATTGEETNRIIESTERAWNEREFIRVDWSTNQLGADDLTGIGINFFIDSGIQIKPASYWESDPTKPDAFHMERADDTDGTDFSPGEANYLDITNKWVISPSQTTLTFEENGQTQAFTVPTCLLGYKLDDCASQVVKVKHAFSKISPQHDYEPRNWDGVQMNLFGIWDVGLNRLTYNRQYGVTNTGFKRHAARFNLWKKSYQDDGKTPIPFEQREMRTTPYYAESSLEPFPPELFDIGKEIIRQWNEAVKTAASLVAKKDPSQLPDAFVWCHNPVKLADDSMGPKDPDACVGNLKPELDAKGNKVLDGNGNPIYHARQGDPRRSNIFWVNQQQDSGPLGYGPPLFDIETGETISGQAYIYGAAVDTYAARSRDLVNLLVGKIDSQSYIDGVNVKDFVSANRSGSAQLDPLYGPDEVQKIRDSMDTSWAKGLAPQNRLGGATGPAQFAQLLRNREDAIYKGGSFGQANADLAQIRRNKLRGTQLEGMMVTPDVMAMGGSTGGDWSSLSDAEKARVSPLRSAAITKAIEDRLDKMRVFGYEFGDFADEGMVQRAIALSKDPNVPNMDDEALRQKLRKDIFLAVTLHEVGHNMGLRHNFRASWDSLNYFDEYWQLRMEWAKSAAAKRFTGLTNKDGSGNFTVSGVPYGTTGCATTPPVAGDKSPLKPRYMDCQGGATSVGEVTGVMPDGTQLKGGVREFQYSSIMDYGAEFNSDFQGLGKYDKAAMKFSYSDQGYVEVFTKAKTSDSRWGWLIYFQNAFGFPSPIFIQSNGGPLQSINYTSYPDMFVSGDYKNITQRKDVPFPDTTYSTSSNLIRYYDDPDLGQLPVVPYYFCSDEFVGNLTCLRFDSGADAFEQAQDLASRYENFYLYNNFKRDRYTFHTSLAYKSRVGSRYFDPLRNQMTWYSLLLSDFEDSFPNTDTFFTDPMGWGNFTIGVSTGLDTLGRTVMRPEAGTYQLVQSNVSPDYPFTYYKKTADATAANPLQRDPSNHFVGLIDGKYIDTTWDFNGCGYYWGDECQTRIGYFIDKTVALDYLTQSQAYFTGRDTSTDVRKYAIGYVTNFRNQLLEKFGAVLAGDYSTYAPRVQSEDSSQQIDVALKSWTTDMWKSRTGGTTSTTPTGPIIDPATGFSTQVYAGVYGLSALPTTFDQSIIDFTRIFVIGNGEAPVPDSDIDVAANSLYPGTASPLGDGGTREWVYVLDPETGKKYAAHSVAPDANGRRLDGAVRMLQTYARLLADRASCSGTQACAAKANAVKLYMMNIDVMRSLHAAYGYGVYKSDTPFMY